MFGPCVGFWPDDGIWLDCSDTLLGGNELIFTGDDTVDTLCVIMILVGIVIDGRCFIVVDDIVFWVVMVV